MGELKVRITPDNLAEVTKQIKKNFKETGDHVEQDFTKKTAKGASSIGDAFQRLKNTIASVFAVSTILAFWKKLLWLWSDVEEFESKFKTVFKGVEEQAFSSFTIMGDAVWRSRTELIKHAWTVGNVFKPLWFATDQALVLSENMIKLAIDVASFNNVSDDQAINAFTRALTGEREALKSLGIVISEADVKTKALELGLAKQGEELSKTAKAMATYQLLLDNTADAQGDAIKTADSFANQLKKVQGIIADTFAKAGRTIAQESAGTLKKVWVFIKAYGEAIFALLIEVGKSVGIFFKEIWSALGGIVEALGFQLKSWEESVSLFGNVLLTILHGLNVGIRSTGLILKGFINLVIWVVQDMVQAFQWGVRLVLSSFNILWTAITTVLSWVANNIIAKIQEWINGAIESINWMIIRLENLVGKDLFWEIGPVGTRNVVQFGAEVSDLFAWLQDEAWGFARDFGRHTAEAFDGIKDDFLDLWAYIINQENTMARQVVEWSQTIGDAYSTAFDQASDLAKQFWLDAWSAGEQASKGASKAKDSLKEIEDQLKEIEKWYDDYESKLEKARDAEKKYITAQRDYFHDLKQSIAEVNEEIEKTTTAFNSDKLSSIQDFARNEIQEQLDLEAQIAETKKAIQDEQQEEEQNLERIKELKEELVQLEQEHLLVQKTIAWLQEQWGDQVSSILEEEKKRASLSNAEQRAYDFQKEQEIKQQEFEQEQAKLEKLRRIYEVFQNYQFTSVEQLQALKNEKRLEELSIEEQELIQKLANERIQLLQQRDEKIQLEREVAQASIKLQNDVYKVASQNLSALDSKYSDLIRKIQQAISAQNQLNTVRASQRYQWGPVRAWSPYLVWENPDGSINPRTTELFVPQVSWSIVPASQVQEALKQITNSVDNSKHIEISWPITLQSEIDLQLLLERASFRL